MECFLYVVCFVDMIGVVNVLIIVDDQVLYLIEW